MELDFNSNPTQPAGEPVAQTNTAVPVNSNETAQLPPKNSVPSGALGQTNQETPVGVQTDSATAPQIKEQTSNLNPPIATAPKKSKTLLILLIILAVVILAVAAYLLLATGTGRGLIGLSDQESSASLETTDGLIANTSQPSASEPEEINATLTNDDQRKQDLKEIQTALEAYKVDKGSYPVSANYSKIGSPESEIYTSLVSGGYMTVMPQDPLAPDYWYGYKSATGAEYSLTARLEDETDSAGEVRGDIILYELTNSSSL